MTRPLLPALGLLTLACAGFGTTGRTGSDATVNPDPTPPDEASTALIPAAIAITVPAGGVSAARPTSAGPWLAFDGDPTTGFSNDVVGPQVMLAGDSHVTGLEIDAGGTGTLTVAAMNTADYSDYAQTFELKPGKNTFKLDFKNVKSVALTAPGVALNEVRVLGAGPTPRPTAQTWGRPVYEFAALHPVVDPHPMDASYGLSLGEVPTLRLPGAAGATVRSAAGDTVSASDNEVRLTKADGTSMTWPLIRLTPCQWIVADHSLVADGCLPQP